MSEFFSDPPEGIDLSESRTSTNNAIGIALFTLAVIAVILRTIARLHFQKVRLEADDYFMYAGMFLGIGNLSCCIAGGFYGLGKHIWSLEPHHMEKISIITFAYVYIYAWSVTVIKCSILLFYRRIFGMTWLAWGCLFITIGYLIANHVVLPLYCEPLPYYWLQFYDDAEGHCPVNEAKFYLGVGIINMFGDIAILSIPIPSVMKLQMPKGQKIAVLFIFLLGGFVCIASIVRIKVIVDLTQTRDISWAKSDVFIWSSVEPCVGIISGCLPTLRSVFVWTLEWCGFTSILGRSRTPNAYKDDGTNGEGEQSRRSRLFDSSGGRGFRPDDEICLTTVTAHQEESASRTTADEYHDPGSEGIMVHKQFRLH